MMFEERLVLECSELSPGDRIEARREGKLLHRGPVLSVVPQMDLFWILDTRTGTRQLLDMDTLRVLHCPVKAVPDCPGPEPTAA